MVRGEEANVVDRGSNVALRGQARHGKVTPFHLMNRHLTINRRNATLVHNLPI
jgi:hypothetical protein